MFSIFTQGFKVLVTIQLSSSKVFEVSKAFAAIFTKYEIAHFLKQFYCQWFHLKYYADQFWIESTLKTYNFNQITKDY